MPDGSRHPLYPMVNTPFVWMTRDYWRYEKPPSAPPLLKLPNGTVYTFGQASGDDLYTTKIEDSYGNTIDVAYMTGSQVPFDGIATITQHLGAQTRTVTFTADTNSGSPTFKSLKTMTFSNRTWNYTQSSAAAVMTGYTYLNTVDPPAGPNWSYTYYTAPPPGNPPGELQTITTPDGGTITYAYTEKLFNMGSASAADEVRSRAVISCTTKLKTATTEGTWTFSYPTDLGFPYNQTQSVSPCGVTTTHTFFGVGTNTAGPVWKIGLPETTTVKDGALVFQTETLAWIPSVQISDYAPTVGTNHDTATFVPLVDTRTIARDGTNWSTDNTYNTSNFNDYGRPSSVLETGELIRTTAYTYAYGFTPYIVDRILSQTETVTGQPLSFTKAYTYDTADGFRKTASIYGIPTTYIQTIQGDGNVGTIRDANNHDTSFTYDWGVVKNTITPEYTITRVINSDGTVASETRNGFQTSFLYDAIGRRTSIDPPEGNTTTFAYDNPDSLGTYSTATRGPSIIKTYLDSFGRVRETQNNLPTPVRTRIEYDPCGRKTYESYPFTTTDIGTHYEYDVLDRVKKSTTPDTEFVLYTYTNGIDVRVTDEENKTTDLNWSAFGQPSDARLMSVTDHNQKMTAYGYNAVGSLTSVTLPGNVTRSFVYNAKNLMTSETHPESGNTSYTYDVAGRMATRTDANGHRTDFTYDDNNRLTYVDRLAPSPGGDPYDTTLAYDDADNRTALSNGFVASTFTYDGANRLTHRGDTVSGQLLNTDFHYDGNDNLTQVDYPSGKSVTYTYDAQATRVTRVDRLNPASTVADTFTYHPSGAVESFRMGGPGGASQILTYDNRYRQKTFASPNLNLTYTYDGVGNVTALTDTRPGLSQQFGYDGLHRLTGVTGLAAGNFTYDERGNRMSKSVGVPPTNYVYDDAKQRLTSTNGGEADSFLYDANGNVIQSGIAPAPFTTYAYTPANMQEQVTTAGNVATYRYDGDDLRTLRVENGRSHYYVHGPGGQLLSELQACSGSPAPSRDYVYLGSRLLAAFRPAVSTPTVQVTLPGQLVPETGSATVLVSVTTPDGCPTTAPVSVSYATANGSATGQDYTAVSGTLPQFPAGSASGTTQAVPAIAITRDPLDEIDETFTLALSDPVGAVLGATPSQTITIQDDDLPPSVSVSDCTLTEGNVGQTYCTFTASLSAASGRTVTVNFATANQTAMAGQDYVANSGTLTFPEGSTSQTFAVAVIGDAMDEPNETYLVNLSSPSNATLGDAQGVGTIWDDDLPPTISISDCTITEGNAGQANCVFSVSLSAASGYTVAVNFATADETATNGVDYYGGSGTLTFPVGSTSQSLPVAVLGDTLDEPNETYTVTLSAPVNATMADGKGLGTITDDDASPSISINDCTATEADSTSVPCTLTATLSASSGFTVTVAYATANGTAVSGADYTAASGTLTFAPGTTTQTFSVNVLGDLLDEDNEIFYANLSSPSNATVADGQGMGTIVDNDPEPTITISDASVTEGDCFQGGMTYTITLTPVSGRMVNFSFASAPGTATDGVDFLGNAGTVSLSPGVTSTTVGVGIVADFVPEPNETVFMDLSNVTNAIVGDGHGIGTIQDDDAGSSGAVELTHGSREQLVLGQSPFGTGTDMFRIAQKPWSSYEVVVDATSGDIGDAPTGVLLQRVMCVNNNSVLQDSSPIGAGNSRSLRWQNATEEPVVNELIRVKSSHCGSDCGRDDVYQIHAYETTYSIPRFNNTAGQTTIVQIQNVGYDTVSGELHFWSSTGSSLGLQPFTLLPKQVMVLDTQTVLWAAGQSGSITINHTGRYGDLVGKATAVEPATGNSFDTPMVPKQTP